MRVIETGSLTLEPQTAAHAEEMFAVLSDPAIYEYENEPPPSLEWLRARFTKLESRRSPNGREQWLNWVIRLPTSELIGYVQATLHPDGRAGAVPAALIGPARAGEARQIGSRARNDRSNIRIPGPMGARRHSLPSPAVAATTSSCASGCSAKERAEAQELVVAATGDDG